MEVRISTVILEHVHFSVLSLFIIRTKELFEIKISLFKINHKLNLVFHSSI